MLFLLMLLGCVKELKNQVIYKGKGDLTQAVRYVRIVVKLLLFQGASVDLARHDGCTPLFVESCNGRKEVVELLLSKGASVDLANKDGATPLFIASRNGHKEIVELLLSKSAVDTRDQNIYTFISNKQNKMSDKLVLISANLNKLKDLDDKDESLVCSVFKCDDRELLIFILDILKENSTITEDFLLIMVALAIELRAFNCLKELFFRIKDREKIDVLMNKYDLSLRVTLSRTKVLAILAEVDKANSVKKVKGNDLPKNETIKKGKGDLIKAAETNQAYDAKRLIEAGEDIDELNEDEQTPLHIAIQNGHLNLAKILILKGATIDLTNKHGETPLYKASQMGQVEIVELLLSKRAAVNSADNGGRTPLYTASQEGHTEVVELLIKNEAKIDLADDGGQTPLNIASQKGHTKVVELLISNGAEIDLADINGWSPLFVATQYGNVEVIRLLKSNGASISKTNNFGETPLSLARQHGYEEIIKILTGK